jgi:hypothetical protein
VTPAFLLLAALAATPGATGSERPPAEEEVRIPFVQFGQIRTFRTEGDDIVYLQDRRRNWYRASLIAPCINLPTATRLGFDRRYSGTLDNTSTLVVRGERCRIASLVRIDLPPPRRARR